MEPGVVGVNIAVLAVSDKPIITDEPTAKLIIDRLGEVGHRIVAREVVRDSEQAIRAQFLLWIADPNVDVVIAAVGIDSDSAGDALEPLITKSLRGFSDLFRMLSYQEIGTAAMLVDAEAAQCGSTYVFLLPASIGAVRTALDKLLIPQLDHRTKPRNLASRFKRNEVVPLVPPDKIAVATPPVGIPLTKPSSAVTPPAGTPLIRTTSSFATPTAGLPVIRPPFTATPPAGLPVVKALGVQQTMPLPTVAEAPASVAPSPAGLPIAKPTSAATPPAGMPVVKPTSAVTPPAGMPVVKPTSVATPVVTPTSATTPPVVAPTNAATTPVVTPTSTATPPAGFAIVKPTSAATPPMGTPLAKPPASAATQPLPLTTQKPATVTTEKTNVGPPPPPPRPAGLPPLPPGAGGAHPTGAIPLLPLSLEELAKSAPPAPTSAKPPARPSTPTPPPPPPVSAAPTRPSTPTPPPPPPPSPPKLPPTKDKTVAMIAATDAVTTGSISTVGDLPVWGDTFVYPKHRRRKSGVLIWLGLAFASAVATVGFIKYREHDRRAVAGNRGTQVATKSPQPEIKPPEVKPPEAPPLPATAPPEVPPEPVAVEPMPPPPPAASVHEKPAKVVAKRSTSAPTPRRPTERVATRQPPPPHPIDTPAEEPAKIKEAPAAAVAEGCDEVSCVLDRYDRPCCERFKPAEKSFKPSAGLPDSLDRSMVVSGIDKMKPVVIRCGETHTASGTVKLAIVVNGDGHVTDVTVSTTPDAALGDCVAAAIRKARFAKTENGGSFSYPFVF